MKYIGEFSDIKGETYKIIIVTNNDETEETKLVLGETPIVTEVNSDDNIFKPVKYGSATISILAESLYLDIYTSKALGTPVKLLDSNNNIKWTGYVTPNVYNLTFSNPIDEIELECIDGLSVLQYLDYKTTKKSFKSFAEIINNILMQVKCYKRFYIQDNKAIDNEIFNNFFTRTIVSELNFFDEDNEAMKMDEVLEEVCRFMGVSCIAYNDEIYFVDYDAIKNNYNNFYDFVVGDPVNERLTRITARRGEFISNALFMDNNNEISLGPTYRKITVTDSLYSTDTILPSLKDKKLLVNRNSNDHYEIIPAILIYDKKYNGFYKFYDHPNCKSYYYRKDTLQPENLYKLCEYQNIGDFIGATLVKVYHEENKNDGSHDLRKIDFKDYILVTNLNKQDNTEVRKLMDIYIDKPLILGGKDIYFVFNGSIIFENDNGFTPATGIEVAFDSFKQEDLYIELILQYGDLYWSGHDWVNYFTTFRLMFDAEDKYDHLFYREFKVKNNIEYWMNIDTTTGLAVKLPENKLVAELPVLSIVQPRHVVTGDTPPFWQNKMKYLSCYWLKDFDIKVLLGNYSDDTELESDTEYCNTVDDTYVNDYDGDDFKICTWDNKAANYSCVAYKNGNNLTYVDKIYNKATKDYCRSEEMYIKTLMRNYSEPPIVLNFTFNDYFAPFTRFTYKQQFGMSRDFIIDTHSMDWRYKTNKLTLVEKK